MAVAVYIFHCIFMSVLQGVNRNAHQLFVPQLRTNYGKQNLHYFVYQFLNMIQY